MGHEPTPLAEHFRRHFAHRHHLYGALLAEMADDLDAGGPTRHICRDHLEAERADAVQLRLLAGLFRLVLDARADELRPFYPSLGGTADPGDAWPLVRPVLAAHTEELHDALDRAPQTNEVGRAACLAVGLFEAVRRHGLHRVRLLEPGASAGLNLNVDRYRLIGGAPRDGTWAWGPADSPLTLDLGPDADVRPEALTIVERRGCDLAPVAADTRAGAHTLTSYVWPFTLDRHDRLAAALAIARDHPVTVDRASASTWLAEQLARPAADDVLTVVWQSVTQQYWPAAETDAVERTVADARTRMPLAHVAMEGVPPVQGTDGYAIAEHGPVTGLDGEPLARSHHHGPPVLTLAPAPEATPAGP